MSGRALEDNFVEHCAGVFVGKRGQMSNHILSTLAMLPLSLALTTYGPGDATTSAGPTPRPSASARIIRAGRDGRDRRSRPRVVPIDARSGDRSAVLGGISTAICGSTGYNYYGR